MIKKVMEVVKNSNGCFYLCGLVLYGGVVGVDWVVGVVGVCWGIFVDVLFMIIVC